MILILHPRYTPNKEDIGSMVELQTHSQCLNSQEISGQPLLLNRTSEIRCNYIENLLIRGRNSSPLSGQKRNLLSTTIICTTVLALVIFSFLFLPPHPHEEIVLQIDFSLIYSFIQVESHSIYPSRLAQFIYILFLRFIHVIARTKGLFLFITRQCAQ